jgi:hypothetical protein
MQKAAEILTSIAEKLNEEIREEPERPRAGDDEEGRKRKLSVESASSQEPRKKKTLISKIFGTQQKRQPTINEENGIFRNFASLF